MIRYIKVYDQVMGNMACNKMIKIFERADEDRIKFHSAGSKFEEMIITDKSQLWGEYGHQLVNLYKSGLDIYRKDCGMKNNRQLPENLLMEQFSMKKYVSNDPISKYRIHSDSNEKGMGNRFVTAMLYLSTPEYGGETEFPSLNLKIKPIQGSMILFPSSWTYMYSENPCKGNINKYTLTAFFRWI